MDLTFNGGTTNQTVMIPIIGDNVVESTESFTVSLTTGDSAVILNPQTTTVTIQDDDSEMHCISTNMHIVLNGRLCTFQTLEQVVAINKLKNYLCINITLCAFSFHAQLWRLALRAHHTLWLKMLAL